MSVCPAYFEPIRQRASQRWDQLEGDPELAGPWHQLFKQVQSPRHIVSELLQNADDAGATEASVSIEDGAFIFEHNGEDFTEEHFASLCRFGYSNKRSLHTIGFRGIGFKSTFSLGEKVELFTPTLSVEFHKNRFTEPKWASDDLSNNGMTTVRVAISDDHRRGEVEKNLLDWLRSPVSLLFFKHIRRIQIGDNELHWGSLGPGPVPETEWLALHNSDDQPFLMARSAPEPFPKEALEEIKQERMINIDEGMEFPPCVVEIVLGVDGRLFVVLPTGVDTALPFACNAPFLQDPARLKIKDPETSPTNRWLLRRAGKLAADVMLEWLRKTTSDLSERSSAYDIMPKVDGGGSSLEELCFTIVADAFLEAIEAKDFLLTEEGNLTASDRCITIPKEIFDVWSGMQAAAILDDKGRPPLSQHVSDDNQTKLGGWGFVEEIDDDSVLTALHGAHLPKPESWRQLLHLWVYIAPAITGYMYRGRKSGLCIVPVQGKNILCASDETVRLGEKKLLPSEDDWRFLGDRLAVLNQNWLRYLTDQRRLAKEEEDDELSEGIDAAYAVLRAISLSEPSDTGKVIGRVADDFFGQEEVPLIDSIRLAQIAAKLGAGVGGTFRFVCHDRHLRSSVDAIVMDADGDLDILLPEDWIETHLLHPDYLNSFTSCTREEWLRWVSSGRAGLLTFVPLQLDRRTVYGEAQIEEIARKRGFQGELSHHYVTSKFVVEDWNFDETLWHHWQKLEGSVDHVWGQVVEQILNQREAFWKKAQNAKFLHVATTGNTRSMTMEPILPLWILKLREKDCLRDMNGFYRKPSELLRRTPETEALMDIEPFVHGLLDNETSRPLLNLLGVGDIPTGPERLLNRLQTLAKSENPPVHEVEKWYRRLDQLLNGCSTEDSILIRDAFNNENLILTEEGNWYGALSVFLSSDEEDAPGAATIRPSVRELTLWRKIGVADRPTVELAIQWLKTLPTGVLLSPDELRRVRSLVTRYPTRIWDDCQHWLSLAGEWTKVEDFEYALTMQTLIPWSHLHQWVKQKTADLQKLPSDVTTALPFSGLSPLAAHVEEQFQRKNEQSGDRENRDWLRQLGRELVRIELDDEKETARIRGLASDLSQTAWQTTHDLETISYIDGKPAGTPRRTDAIWREKVLYAEDKSLPKLARSITQELGRSFLRADIIDAIRYCIDRSSDFITQYMAESFSLLSREELPSTESDAPSPRETNDVVKKTGVLEQFDGEETSINEELKAGQKDGHDDIEISIGTETCEEDIDISDDSNDSDEIVVTHRQRPKPPKPSIMERFALSQGFQKDHENRFFDDHGNWISRVGGALFPWEKISAEGDVIRHYWPKDHCLEQEPLQLEAEVWSLVESQSEVYVLVLSDPEGDPVEILGSQLCEMRERGDLTLHPSTYRLMYQHGN
jgi:hypothetical protein